jgi:hypothetical protein
MIETLVVDPDKVATFPKKIGKDELQKKILEFCSDWKTVLEIANYVQRTKLYIRNKVLPEMSDKLQMLYPKGNHPGQKYKVKE